MTTQFASTNTQASLGARHTRAPGSTTLTVRARTTCTGAHVHVGSLKLRHEEVSEFAGRFQERPAASVLARLTSCAVNEIKGTLAPRMGLRVYAVSATAITDDEPREGLSDISLDLEIESPDDEQGIERLVRAWQEELSPSVLPVGVELHVSFRVLDWYSA